MSNFNDRIRQVQVNNFTTPPQNLPEYRNPYLLVSKNKAYNQLATKKIIKRKNRITNQIQTRSDNGTNLSDNGTNQTTEDYENLATHVMSEVYLSPDKRRPIIGYTRLREYGTDETVVYSNNKNVIIGMRGSTLDHFGRDYATDAEIVSGYNITGGKKRRFDMANETYRKIRAKFPNKHIVLGGHSLGNAIILDVLKNNKGDNNLNAYGFNGLEHPDYNEDSRYVGRRREGDLVSYLNSNIHNTSVDAATQSSIDTLRNATIGLSSAGAGGVAINRAILARAVARERAHIGFWGDWFEQNQILDNPPNDTAYEEAYNNVAKLSKEIPKRYRMESTTDITDDLVNDGILDAGEIENRYFASNADAIPYIIGHYGEAGEGEDEFLFDMEYGGLNSVGFQHPQTGEMSTIRSSEWFADMNNVDTTSTLLETAAEEAAPWLMGAFGVMGAAALTAYGGYWLYSHSTSRFKPKKNLFKSRPVVDNNAPATKDELLDAKYRADKFTSVAAPIMKGVFVGTKVATAYEVGGYYLGERAAKASAIATYDSRTAATINNAFRDGKAINYRNDPFEVIRPTNPNLDNALIRARGTTPRVQGMLDTAKKAISNQYALKEAGIKDLMSGGMTRKEAIYEFTRREKQIKQLADDWEMTRSQALSFMRSQAKRKG